MCELRNRCQLGLAVRLLDRLPRRVEARACSPFFATSASKCATSASRRLTTASISPPVSQRSARRFNSSRVNAFIASNTSRSTAARVAGAFSSVRQAEGAREVDEHHAPVARDEDVRAIAVGVRRQLGEELASASSAGPTSTCWADRRRSSRGRLRPSPRRPPTRRASRLPSPRALDGRRHQVAPADQAGEFVCGDVVAPVVPEVQLGARCRGSRPPCARRSPGRPRRG